MGEKVRNRWLILFAGIICNLCIGAVYAWSVFQKPLMQLFQWTSSQASLTFTITLCMMPIAMTFAGKIEQQKGPKVVIGVGGLLFGVGILLSGFTKSLAYLYVVHGVIGGLGVGTVYGIAVSNSVKWFPDKKGLASGLIAAGLGMGAVVFAPIANTLINAFGVLRAFNILGAVYLIAIIGAAFVIARPPAGYQPAGWTPPETSAAGTGPSASDKNWKEMMADPMFYVLWVMYALGATSGLMIIGHASGIAQESVGLSATTAALAVSILALANTSGRLFWGAVSDKFGRYSALFCIYTLSAVMMYVLSTTRAFAPFLLVICCIGLCFGGLLGIFPTVTADLFGLKNLGQNYGIMFFAFAAAAFIGPRLAATVKETSGDYSLAFIVTAAMGAAGALLTLFVMAQLKKRKKGAATKK